jgi:hypothetical protein
MNLVVNKVDFINLIHRMVKKRRVSFFCDFRIQLDPSMVLASIILSTFILIIIFSIVAIYCCCRSRRLRKRREYSNKKKLPIVYDEHYSINELIKEVGSLRTCNTSLNNTDRLSLRIESTGQLFSFKFSYLQSSRVPISK